MNRKLNESAERATRARRGKSSAEGKRRTLERKNARQAKRYGMGA